MLPNRLKEILPSIVAPNRSIFLPGRLIVDNIVIYQELLHYMRTRRGGKGIMIIKIDLEKAYGRLS